RQTHEDEGDQVAPVVVARILADEARDEGEGARAGKQAGDIVLQSRGQCAPRSMLPLGPSSARPHMPLAPNGMGGQGPARPKPSRRRGRLQTRRIMLYGSAGARPQRGGTSEWQLFSLHRAVSRIRAAGSPRPIACGNSVLWAWM